MPPSYAAAASIAAASAPSFKPLSTSANRPRLNINQNTRPTSRFAISDNSSRLVQQPSLSNRTTPTPRHTPLSPVLTPDQIDHSSSTRRYKANSSTSHPSTASAPPSNGALLVRANPDSSLVAHTFNYSSSSQSPRGHALTARDASMKHQRLPELPSSPITAASGPQREDNSANIELPPNPTPRRAFTSPIPSSNRSSPSPMATLMAQPRMGARPDTIARNSSMDSAMSISSGTSATPSILSHSTNHSHQSSGETTITQSSPDTAALVAQAGGNPVPVIEKLLKENKGLTSRNEQLWRFVEKQRTLLHGLTADLERALKDKERYRKTLKEYQRAVPAVPRPSAGTVEIKENQKIHTSTGGHSKLASMESMTPTKEPMSPRSPRGTTHHMVPSQDSQFIHVSENSQIGGQTANADAVKSESSLEIIQPTSLQQQESQQHQQSSTTPKAPGHKPLSSPGEKPRKAVPAPLNLSATKASTKYVSAPDQTSASDYGDDDSSLTTKIPEFERGRRRTRAEDDREREMIALAEEARSQSGKSKKSQGKQKVNEEESDPEVSSPTKVSHVDNIPPPVIPGPGLPSSPRAALPPGFLPASQGPADSIAAILAPPEVTAPVSRSIALPPKSPGLPMSPKPSDRPNNAPIPRPPINGLASPGPLSPRQGLPLSPRAPKYPIPLPSTTAQASTISSSTRLDSEELDSTSMAARIHPAQGSTKESNESSSRTDSTSSGIYQGYMSQQYPGLLLPPNALSLVTIKACSLRLRPSIHSAKSNSDELVFTLGVYSRSNQKQLWRVEKKPVDLESFGTTKRSIKLPSAPDQNMFTGHAPAKIDERRNALNQYFKEVFQRVMFAFDRSNDDKVALFLCDFFSKDVIEREEVNSSEDPASPTSPRFIARKEGYLAKKGKMFGGWKSRYFILESSRLKYFDSPSGGPLGIIKLEKAQLWKQTGEDVDEDAEFRHAFTIFEPKLKDVTSHVRHVLCAESDDERDRWVEAISQHLAVPAPIPTSPPTSPIITRADSFTPHTQSETTKRRQRTQDSVDSQRARELQSISYDDTVIRDAPLAAPSINLSTPSPYTDDHSFTNVSTPTMHSNISGPLAGGPIQNPSIWGNKETKKRSVFGFMNRSADEVHSSHGMKRGLSPRPPAQAEGRIPSRPVFGIPLTDAAEYSQPTRLNICLPSPVYRCIEYLEANDAVIEEGIFRLSGSNTTVKQLKERFDNERDVNLLAGPYIDIHAVASLLKLYLRELPDPILSSDKSIDFQKVLEVEDKPRRLAAINLLIHQLPEANREVLVALFSYLIKVVKNAERNKMSAKNIGIVFIPTLSIPPNLFNTFITDFDSVFTAAPADPDAASPVLENIAAFKAQHPTVEAPRPPEAHSIPDLGEVNKPGQDSSISGITDGMRAMQFAQRHKPGQHSPKTSQNSFTERLAEQRQQLRQASAESRESNMSSAPVSGKPTGFSTTPSTSSLRRARQSPSPASRSYQPASSRSTPPPNDNTTSNGGNAPSAGIQSSSTASSPSSFASSSLKGRDSPNMNGTGNGVPAPPMSRKAKRESAMLGNVTLGSDHKVSYNQLRNYKNVDLLEEEE